MLLGAAVLPASASDCTGFLPPNDLKIPVGSIHAKGIIEAQFNAVIDTVEKLYKPVVAAQGKVLQINRLWANETVNANASQQGNKYILNMYGGLARHETITMDGFALVVCHELGHHLGGVPKVSSWASNEGQSDYYANLKCLRQVFTDDSSLSFTRMSAGDEVAEMGCAKAFSDPLERSVCARGAMAGKSVAYLFKILRKETVDPRFDTPDANVVPTMMTTHPGTQCRMDTYLQGSVCIQPVSNPVNYTSPAAGTCTRSAGFSGGFRPLCWYKPANPAELLPPAAKLLPPAAEAFGVTDEMSPTFHILNSGYVW